MKDRTRSLRARGVAPLLAFMVHDGKHGESLDEDTCAAVVYAHDETEARKLAVAQSLSLADRVDVLLAVERRPECDRFADVPRVAQYAWDVDAERAAGFSEEGQYPCTVCRLADISSTFLPRPSWALCDDCGQCGACGHDMLCAKLAPALGARMAKKALRRFRREAPGRVSDRLLKDHSAFLTATIKRLTDAARLERAGRAAWQRLGLVTWTPIDPLEEAVRDIEKLLAEPEPSRLSIANAHCHTFQEPREQCERDRQLAIDLGVPPVRGFRPEAIKVAEEAWASEEGRAAILESINKPEPKIRPWSIDDEAEKTT